MLRLAARTEDPIDVVVRIGRQVRQREDRASHDRLHETRRRSYSRRCASHTSTTGAATWNSEQASQVERAARLEHVIAQAEHPPSEQQAAEVERPRQLGTSTATAHSALISNARRSTPVARQPFFQQMPVQRDSVASITFVYIRRPQARQSRSAIPEIAVRKIPRGTAAFGVLKGACCRGESMFFDVYVLLDGKWQWVVKVEAADIADAARRLPHAIPREQRGKPISLKPAIDSATPGR